MAGQVAAGGGKKKRRCERVRVQSGEDQSSVRALYSEDGRWLFVCAGHTVKVYSTTSHELVHLLEHHGDQVTACCINPSNTLQLLTASLDGKVVMWDYLDGAMLREIEFGVPIFHYAIRPGKKEPQMFFQIEKGTMEVDPNEELELGAEGAANKVVVGLSSDVITNRQPADSPGNQLARAREYMSMGVKSTEICFSYNGRFVVTFINKSLAVCDIEAERFRSFRSPTGILAIACHPSELCVATGNQRGEVQLWWRWNHRTKQPVITTLHWHAHAVADLCFTSDGTYLLSGGEECVLVVWQVSSNTNHFRPRLGAQITRIACAPADQSFAISLQNNVIQVVSGLDNEVEWSVGGMRRAHMQSPKENGMKTGLTWDPRSRSIVANSSPGSLQWYRPDIDAVTTQLDVTGLNYVSRMSHSFVLMTVEHAAFSSDGQWLATVEWRDDGKTTPELRLKFWQFDSSTQEFELNTCVEPPHDKKITSLLFQPQESRTNGKKTNGESILTTMEPSPAATLAVSTSKDGKFKSWILVDGGRGEGKKMEEEGGRDNESSWACRSVGYYHSLPCRGARFSEDGSLLAVNFKKFLTLWDPYTCDFRKAFGCPFPSETFIQHTFGSSTSSHYLLASSDHHLIVWDLLSCSVLWSVAVDVDVLLCDPFGPMATAFVPSKEDTTHLYMFNPCSPTPISVWECVCSGAVTSALYTPTTAPVSVTSQRESVSNLFFQTASQVLYTVCTGKEDSKPLTVVNEAAEERRGRGAEERRGNEESRQAYFEIFGEPKKGEVAVVGEAGGEESHHLRRRDKLKVLDAAPHVLPPLGSLSGPFLQSLLPTQRGREREGDEGTDVESDEEGERVGRAGVRDDDSDTSDTVGQDSPYKGKRVVERSATDLSDQTAMETDSLALTNFKVGNYNWLSRHHFGEIMMVEPISEIL